MAKGKQRQILIAESALEQRTTHLVPTALSCHPALGQTDRILLFQGVNSPAAQCPVCKDRHRLLEQEASMIELVGPCHFRGH